MSRPRIADLFCCEGGAASGLYAAGFSVAGFDIAPQPLYPFDFHQVDVTGWDGHENFWREEFDAIWASPPCQSYSTMSNRHGSDELELIDETRTLLQATGLPWIMENVTGARSHMRSPIMIHGGQLGLRVYRPRLFESNVILHPPQYAPKPVDPVAVYGRQESPGRLLWTRNDGTTLRAASLDEARDAMGMSWASWNGCREAIPPAYAEYVGRQLIGQLAVAA